MKKYLISFLCALVIITAVSAQDVSEKKEIAVFSLSYSDWSIPTGALAIVDQQIVEVLTNIGRFDVKGLEFRLKAEDVTDFIDTIRGINEANMVVDESYRLGEALFTEADFEELVGSFIIVIPALTFYDVVVEDTDDGLSWEVELQTSFSFILVSDSTAIANFTIDTFGTGETQREATLDAAEAISGQLEYELKSIEEFQLKSGIIEILPGDRVIIELGSDMGLVRGEEFSIVTARTLDSGRVFTEKTGLIVVSDVKNEVSFGRILYSESLVSPGDQLVEIPRMGWDLSVYGSLLISIDDWGISGGMAGLKFVPASGFYDIRPLAGVEIPFVQSASAAGWPGFPASFYAGGELMWFFRRLQIEPSIALGATGLIPLSETDSFRLTHFGGKAELDINWMISDGFRIFLNGGYTHWFALNQTVLPSVSAYGGIFAGLGVTFKL